MRYYDLKLSNTSGQVYAPDINGGFTLGNAPTTFTSFPGGFNDPGALDVEFDLPVYAFHTPQGSAIIRVWGIGLGMISQAANLNGSNFVLSAGMQQGLPLANPAQAGVIAQGTIFQAFGNWTGVDQTLDLICYPGGLNPAAGIFFSWSPGTPLSAALQTSLTQAFPGYTPAISISSNLQPPKNAPQNGWYESLTQFAQYIQEITQPLGEQVTGNPSYPGVQILIDGTTINVIDGTLPPSRTVNLAFQDLIGQPTWIGPATVSFKTVLRADIDIGHYTVFPPGVIGPYAITTPGAAIPNAPARSKSIFQGSFTVTEIHHYARFRQPDAQSWNTTFTAVPNLVAPS